MFKQFEQLIAQELKTSQAGSAPSREATVEAIAVSLSTLAGAAAYGALKKYGPPVAKAGSAAAAYITYEAASIVLPYVLDKVDDEVKKRTPDKPRARFGNVISGASSTVPVLA